VDRDGDGRRENKATCHCILAFDIVRKFATQGVERARIKIGTYNRISRYSSRGIPTSASRWKRIRSRLHRKLRAGESCIIAAIDFVGKNTRGGSHGAMFQ